MSLVSEIKLLEFSRASYFNSIGVFSTTKHYNSINTVFPPLRTQFIWIYLHKINMRGNVGFSFTDLGFNHVCVCVCNVTLYLITFHL